MARKSLGNRQARREILVAGHAARRAELKRRIAHPDTDQQARAEAVRQLARLPRIRFRQTAPRGELPGIRKAFG